MYQCLLHWAIGKSRVALLRPLVKLGADPNTKDEYGRSLIHRACGNGQIAIALELAALGADPTAKANDV